MERLNEVLNLYKLPILLSFIGLILIIGGLFISSNSTKPSIALPSLPKESIIKDFKDIKVDISGAVVNPGVYSLAADDRLEDAIKSAGGFKEGVNTEFVAKKLNLSQKITDGSKIYIPFKGEEGNVLGVSSAAAGGSSKVALNSATSAQLEALPGIGEVTAAKIINARPYQDVNDLVIKKVVSKTVFTKIKDLVDLN